MTQEFIQDAGLRKILDPLLKSTLTQKFNALTGLKVRPTSTHLPVANPKSLSREDMKCFQMETYRASQKTNGIRMNLFITSIPTEKGPQEYAILIDRSFQFYPILSEVAIDPNLLVGTILDCELVPTLEDDDGGNGSDHTEADFFLVLLDILCCNGYDMKPQSHSRRLSVLRANLSRGIFPKRFIEPCSIELQMKKWVSVSDAETLYKSTIGDHCDGLIFICDEEPIRFGAQSKLFKWKPAMMNTVDFLIYFTPSESAPKIYLQDEHSRIVECPEELRIFMDDTSTFFTDLASCNNIESGKVIIECFCIFNHNCNRWIATPYLLRQDKQYPNSIYVVRQTLQQLVENILVEEFSSLCTPAII